MLPHLPGFEARPTAAGYLLVPADMRSGFIRYERRVRPLASVSQLLAPRLANMRVTERQPIAPMFTTEGEHAARLTLHGVATIDAAVPQTSVLGGAWMRRDFGIVFGDDFAAIVDATCIDRAAADLYDAAVDVLVRGIVFGAPLRRRRYRYAAPPDRTPRVRDLETDWIGGDPSSRAPSTHAPSSHASSSRADDTLTVFPAERATNELALAIAARDGFVIASVERIDAETMLVTASSGNRLRHVAARAKHGWLYAMELVGHRGSERVRSSGTPSAAPSDASNDTPSDAPSDASNDTTSHAPSDVSTDTPSRAPSDASNNASTGTSSDAPSDDDVASPSIASLLACIASIEPLPAPVGRVPPTFHAFEVE